MNKARLEKLRDRIYRRTRQNRIRTMSQAARFIDRVGFCLLFASAQDLELPSLFEAVKGRRDARIADWDSDSDRVWVWKNDLPAAKRAYYGKALANGKPVFISLEMLPYYYSLHAPSNLNDEYRNGRLSYAAKQVYDVLTERGPMPTIALRAAARLERDARGFHRSLDELQRSLVILPTGAVSERGAWPSQVFELTVRWFPRQVARAGRIEAVVARRKIVEKYAETVVAAKVGMVARLFGMRRSDVAATTEDLIARKLVKREEDWVVANA